jgi:diketogulonate reductase-like aldo/keto reductase
MQAKPFGWTGVPVPVIGQGTWMIEGNGARERRAIEALRTGLELGLTHVDTAEMYGSGRAEELVGEAIEGRRMEVFLTSKVLPSNASYEGTLRACETSLQRLRTNQLDLYLLHWESRHPIAETMRAMEKLVADGLVRYIGVSNFDVPQVRSAQQALRHHRLACNQVLYHLGDRGIERKLIPYCAREGIAVIGYSPFGSDRGFPSAKSAGGRVLDSIATRHKATARQVVLQFLIRRSGVFTIPKSSDPSHTRENSASLDFELTSEEMAAIDRAFPAPDRDVPLGMI